MNKKIKRLTASALAVLSLTGSMAVNSVTASAANTDRCNVKFTYLSAIPPYNEDSSGVPGFTFAICPDRNGDGKFTKGVDDKSTYKATSDSEGNVLFRNLQVNKTYFITQLDNGSGYYIDKEVYPFNLSVLDSGRTVDLLERLPVDTYKATVKITALMHYTWDWDKRNESGIEGATFAICPDRDGDGVFTKGIDDKVMYKTTSTRSGGVYFENLSSHKTYFITQLSSGDERLACDKNVYPLYFGLDSREINSGSSHVDILDYLPSSTYKAHFTTDAAFFYKTSSDYMVEGTTFAVCADIDGDGVFTKGIDDVKIIKSTSDERGLVRFNNLEEGKRYFITQISSTNKSFILNKNVYSFIIKESDIQHYSYEDGNITYLWNLLPGSAVTAKRPALIGKQQICY